MTCNGTAADDLVQDAATKALAACDAFEPGTNFRAWIRRIILNHFISGVRSRRKLVDVEAMPERGMERRTRIGLY
jgi:RNA polymerase sigma-70 factor, ECF subfamily